jgi:hypothetical protein
MPPRWLLTTTIFSPLSLLMARHGLDDLVAFHRHGAAIGVLVRAVDVVAGGLLVLLVVLAAVLRRGVGPGDHANEIKAVGRPAEEADGDHDGGNGENKASTATHGSLWC